MTRVTIAGPVYVDASAWVKLYVQEAHSDAVNSALLGRRDLFVSDLGATEVASALGRACREGRLDPPADATPSGQSRRAFRRAGHLAYL